MVRFSAKHIITRPGIPQDSAGFAARWAEYSSAAKREIEALLAALVRLDE
jgi:hypothetical protein